jgi:hypothetical protein
VRQRRAQGPADHQPEQASAQASASAQAQASGQPDRGSALVPQEQDLGSAR